MGGNLTGRTTFRERAHARGDESDTEGEAGEDSEIRGQTPGPGAAQASTGEVQARDDAGGAAALVPLQGCRLANNSLRERIVLSDRTGHRFFLFCRFLTEEFTVLFTLLRSLFFLQRVGCVVKNRNTKD
jgi:hypothetical protein